MCKVKKQLFQMPAGFEGAWDFRGMMPAEDMRPVNTEICMHFGSKAFCAENGFMPARKIRRSGIFSRIFRRSSKGRN